MTVLNRMRTGVIARRADCDTFEPDARSRELYCGVQIIRRDFSHEASLEEKQSVATHFISCLPLCSMVSTVFRANASPDGCVRTWVDHPSMICGVDCCGLSSFAALSHGHKHTHQHHHHERWRGRTATTNRGDRDDENSDNNTRTKPETETEKKQPKLTAGTSR